MAEVSRPPPPKKPTIIRRLEIQNSEEANDSEPNFRRTGPPHGGGRPPPKPPNRPPLFRDGHKEETDKVQLRPSANRSRRPVTMGTKTDTNTKRKLEITIVSARPMSEIGFREMSKNNEVESTKPATDIKMTPPTTLVPDKNYLPPRPTRPDSVHHRPPRPVPTRKDISPSHNSNISTIQRSPSLPSPQPHMNKSSPESPPSLKSRSNVPCPESSPPVKPRKHATLPARPLPPSPALDEDESTVVSETPAKPQRTYAWSLDEEIQKVSESSVSDKPRRPTIIRPSKLNKNVSMDKEHPPSQVEESVSSSPEKGSLPPVPVQNFEKSIEINAKKNENVEVMPEKSVHNSENIKNEMTTAEKVSEKKKPPVAAKPKPSVLPKPKLKPQANVTEENHVEIKESTDEKIVSESESKKIRKPTIIRANIPKHTSGEQSNLDTSAKTPNVLEDIPDYATIQKPTTEKSPVKPKIPSSTPSMKPPPPVPEKRFTPPSTMKSKDDFEIRHKLDNLEVQNRPKPVARTRPMSMMITSTAKVERTSPSKPPPPNIGAPTKPLPPKHTPSTERPVRPSPTQPEMTGFGSESPGQEKVPPARPLSVPRSKVTSQQHDDQSIEEDHEEPVQSKPVRPKTAPIRPSRGPIKSPSEDHGNKKATGTLNKMTTRKEAAPDLPSRPGPGHPLYHHMLKVPHGQALHDYDGSNPDDLSFKANDIIILHRRIDEAWLYGQIGEAQGIFPQRYIHILRPLDGDVQISPQQLVLMDNTSESDSSPSISLKEKTDWINTGPRCVARFDFEGEGAGDLCFEEGDYIRLLGRVDSEWVKGELYGKVGIFPLTFVEMIEDLPAPTQDGMNEMISSEETKNTTGLKDKDIPKSDDFHTEPKPITCTMCQAIADFPGESSEDLSFTEGDMIEITREIDENWLRGRLKNKEGIFPASFVIRLDTHTSNPTVHSVEDRFGEALYDFEGENDKELSFKTGDMIRLGTTVEGDDDWQWGEFNGQSGIFPKTFVQVIS